MFCKCSNFGASGGRIMAVFGLHMYHFLFTQFKIFCGKLHRFKIAKRNFYYIRAVSVGTCFQ